MIPRYSTPRLEDLWSERQRLLSWIAIEVDACVGMAVVGMVPHEAADRIRQKLGEVDIDKLLARSEALEAEYKHDVIGFLAALEEVLGDDAQYLHRGMTSSDVLDTSLAIRLTLAADAVLDALDELLKALKTRALEHKHTVMIGRSHGIHAEPTTFGLVLLGHYVEFGRHRERLEHARASVAVAKLSGAVGTYAHLPPTVERIVCQRVGLEPDPVSTQVVARDRHAELFCALAMLGGGIERLATEVRHLQRSEVGEVEEPFGNAQKGSSAMPHKRNPILSENLTGLARLLRSYAVAALEDQALWHQRDISHSSVERVIAPDATTVAEFALRRLAKLVAGLRVYPERMKKNLEQTRGLVYSGTVLTALLDKGLRRQVAYELVQRNAMRAIESGEAFAVLLRADPELKKHLSEGELAKCLGPERHVAHVDEIFGRVLGPAK